MHWITEVLKELVKNEKVDLICLLEKYCEKKVAESDYQNKKGIILERIVYSYLDYLIYRDGYPYKEKFISPMKNGWEFQYRISIEHFQPQTSMDGKDWEYDDLHRFGNLALITASGNSKLSNLPPIGKIKVDHIIEQSLKLKIMAKLTENKGEWTQEMAKEHQKEMFRILDQHGVKDNSNH